jgi:hypothetical protein
MSRRTGIASLPLHSGKAPSWLFSRMTRLSREIVVYMVREFGAAEVLRRLSDPFWFQSFGCVLGFDWHSSGVTTTVCGAVKEGLRGIDRELGLFAAGGKGGMSRLTPTQIAQACERTGGDGDSLVYASRMAAKVDSAAVQDGYQLYHHAFFFTTAGEWCVVQQGMSDATRLARRYHWLSQHVASFVDEPHDAICCDAQGETLNMVAHENAPVRSAVAELASTRPADVLAAMQHVPCLAMPVRHTLFPELDIPDRQMHTILTTTYERAPKDFQELLGIPGVGPKTIRALALTSEIMHGTPASLRDPARFAFAHGGKDGTPFPVDRETYDRTIEVLGKALNRASVDRSEKVAAFRRLGDLARSFPPMNQS